MTGGSLPAMIWHEIMTYAHQGQEIRPIPGLAPLDKPAVASTPVAQNRPNGGFEIINPVPASRLTRRGADALSALDQQLKAQPTRGSAAVRVLEPSATAGVQIVRSMSGGVTPR